MLDAVSRQDFRANVWWYLWLAEDLGHAMAMLSEERAIDQLRAAYTNPLYNLAHYGPDGAEDGWRDFMELGLEQEDAASAHPLWNLGRL